MGSIHPISQYSEILPFKGVEKEGLEGAVPILLRMWAPASSEALHSPLYKQELPTLLFNALLALVSQGCQSTWPLPFPWSCLGFGYFDWNLCTWMLGGAVGGVGVRTLSWLKKIYSEVVLNHQH